ARTVRAVIPQDEHSTDDDPAADGGGPGRAAAAPALDDEDVVRAVAEVVEDLLEDHDRAETGPDRPGRAPTRGPGAWPRRGAAGPAVRPRTPAGASSPGFSGCRAPRPAARRSGRWSRPTWAGPPPARRRPCPAGGAAPGRRRAGRARPPARPGHP